MSALNRAVSGDHNPINSAMPDPNRLTEIRKVVTDLIERATGQKQVIVAHTIIVDFFDRDHNAAILLNQILYWTHRTSDPDGWFYKTYDQWLDELRFSAYQVWRVVRGDDRVQKAKRTLWSIGLETDVRMAPNGRNAVHYRLNVPAFMTAFTEWLTEAYGLSLGEQPQHISDEQQTPTTRPNPQPTPSIFTLHRDRLGRPGRRHRRRIWKCQHALGKRRTERLINQFAAGATSWNEVCTALEDALVERTISGDNGTAVPLSLTSNVAEQASDPFANVRQRIGETRWANWQHADRMLKIHMRSDYDRLLANSELVDHQAAPQEQFTLIVPDERTVQELEARWGRFVRRYASDAIGREVDVRFVTRASWQVQIE